MINGIFLDPRTWKIDYLENTFWDPQKYGVNIDLHPDAFNIPKLGIDKKYKFVIATEIWEIPIRKTLKYLREKGLKIFFIPREPIKSKILYDAMFSYEKFLFDGEYYFNPDIVFCSGKAYADAWKNKCRTEIIGYTRFEQYLVKRNNNEIRKKYNLKDKYTIFFPSFPPYHYKKVDEKDIMIDLKEEHEEIMKGLEILSRKYQIVVKIHPVSQKCFNKKIGNEIFGTLLKYYNNQTETFRVIKDDRLNGCISKDLLYASDLVMGFASTMILEAFILKKPIINLLFGKTKYMENLIEYKKDFDSVYDYNEMIRLVENKIPAKKKSEIFSHYIEKVDGNFCNNLCKIIKNEI